MPADSVTLLISPSARQVHLRAPGLLAHVLLGLTDSSGDEHHPIGAPGPLAVPSQAARDRDDLADLEAQFVADDLEATQAAARRERNGVARDLLAAGSVGPDLTLTLDLAEAREFTAWLNEQYVRLRVAELTSVAAGQGQSALGVLGLDDDLDESVPPADLTALLACLVTELTRNLDAFDCPPA